MKDVKSCEGPNLPRLSTHDVLWYRDLISTVVECRTTVYELAYVHNETNGLIDIKDCLTLEEYRDYIIDTINED